MEHTRKWALVPEEAARGSDNSKSINIKDVVLFAKNGWVTEEGEIIGKNGSPIVGSSVISCIENGPSSPGYNRYLELKAYLRSKSVVSYDTPKLVKTPPQPKYKRTNKLPSQPVNKTKLPKHDWEWSD